MAGKSPVIDPSEDKLSYLGNSEKLEQESLTNALHYHNNRIIGTNFAFLFILGMLVHGAGIGVDSLRTTITPEGGVGYIILPLTFSACSLAVIISPMLMLDFYIF